MRRQRLLLAGGGLIIVFFAVLLVRSCGRQADGGRSSSLPNAAQTESAPETAVSTEQFSVNGIDLTGKTRSEVRALLIAQEPWNITVSHDGQSDKVEDLAAPALDAFLDRLCAENPSGAYSFSPADEKAFQKAAEDAAANFAKLWDKPAKNSSIDGYDAANDLFTFTDGENGRTLDQDKFISDLTSAVQSGSFDAELTAVFTETAPELDEAAAREQYQLLATFTTETTANEKRNTNVRLAAQALNGTVVKPGEEFSFNQVVGERTAEKGYQEAAAYNSGEVVQEIGGGVCQISSTLYHTAFQAGMNITYRRSHTFEPNYVTPGQDAAISWELPDFRFINSSKAAIGIRASYGDRKATVAIYGVPVLEEGISLSLESEKTEELPPPEPSYIEDQTLEPGKEVVEKSGTNGSHWVTYKIISKNGTEIERTKDHEKTYKGHAAVIRRNTSGVQLAPDETTAAPKASIAPTVDGMPDGYVPGESAAPESSAAALPEETAAAQTEHDDAASENRQSETGSRTDTGAGAQSGTSAPSGAPALNPQAGPSAETELPGAAETLAEIPDEPLTVAPQGNSPPDTGGPGAVSDAPLIEDGP